MTAIWHNDFMINEVIILFTDIFTVMLVTIVMIIMVVIVMPMVIVIIASG